MKSIPINSQEKKICELRKYSYFGVNFRIVASIFFHLQMLSCRHFFIHKFMHHLRGGINFPVLISISSWKNTSRIESQSLKIEPYGIIFSFFFCSLEKVNASIQIGYIRLSQSYISSMYTVNVMFRRFCSLP